ncbi:MAG: hypothetical protein JO321_00545 [Solirubrobacterales bacterium]|nr:hypothetical protein [Solirubrobacterales bacterium]MBV9164888.1 hypothetical protein [Solirubrobacterales bacterium]MBV9533882.1 hypothetical protein [Solirubrobacterales bacterium]
MQITRNSRDTTTGPGDWFTGTVFIGTVADPMPPARVGAGVVHFTPGRPHRLAHRPARPDHPTTPAARQLGRARNR